MTCTAFRSDSQTLVDTQKLVSPERFRYKNSVFHHCYDRTMCKTGCIYPKPLRLRMCSLVEIHNTCIWGWCKVTTSAVVDNLTWIRWSRYIWKRGEWRHWHCLKAPFWRMLKAPSFKSLGQHISVFRDRSERRLFNMIKKYARKSSKLSKKIENGICPPPPKRSTMLYLSKCITTFA